MQQTSETSDVCSRDPPELEIVVDLGLMELPRIYGLAPAPCKNSVSRKILCAMG